MCGRARDHYRRLSVANEIGQLGWTVSGVERQIHEARTQATEVQEQRLRRLFQLDCDPIAASQALPAQQGCIATRLPFDVRIGVLGPRRRLEGDPLRVGDAARLHQCIQVGVVGHHV